jgi:hypothetical protein
MQEGDTVIDTSVPRTKSEIARADINQMIAS